MSNRYVEKHVPAVTTRTIVGQDCDRCGRDVPKPKQYSIRDFTLEFAEGYTYPSDSEITDGFVIDDLCDECVSLLLTLLTTNGFKTRELP